MTTVRWADLGDTDNPDRAGDPGAVVVHLQQPWMDEPAEALLVARGDTSIRQARTFDDDLQPLTYGDRFWHVLVWDGVEQQVSYWADDQVTVTPA